MVRKLNLSSGETSIVRSANLSNQKERRVPAACNVPLDGYFIELHGVHWALMERHGDEPARLVQMCGTEAEAEEEARKRNEREHGKWK